MAVILFREEGEIDFKMSCPACGQKLWVRDTDVGKRGRCPNCKKAFKLPSQAGHLKSQLMLPDAVPALTVVRGKAASCRGALASLIAYLRRHDRPAVRAARPGNAQEDHGPRAGVGYGSLIRRAFPSVTSSSRRYSAPGNDDAQARMPKE